MKKCRSRGTAYRTYTFPFFAWEPNPLLRFVTRNSTALPKGYTQKWVNLFYFVLKQFYSTKLLFESQCFKNKNAVRQERHIEQIPFSWYEKPNNARFQSNVMTIKSIALPIGYTLIAGNLFNYGSHTAFILPNRCAKVNGFDKMRQAAPRLNRPPARKRGRAVLLKPRGFAAGL